MWKVSQDAIKRESFHNDRDDAPAGRRLAAKEKWDC